jgi:hypothetical protein
MQFPDGHYLGILVCAFLLGGCASVPDVKQQRLQSLPQHYSQFDVEIAWQAKSVGGQSLIEGELKSIRYQYMDNIEVWVEVLDAVGKPVARSVSYIIPHEVKQGEIEPFSVKLPVAVPPGTRLRFTYKYDGTDGGDSKGDFRTQSFVAAIAVPQ